MTVLILLISKGRMLLLENSFSTATFVVEVLSVDVRDS